MKKRTWVVIATAVILLGAVIAGVLLLQGDDTPVTEASTPIEQSSVAQDTTDKPSQAAVESNVAGSYLDLATYQQNTAAYSASKKIYFFHASWCPICTGIDEDIKSNPSQLPDATTIIKTDFDSNVELRQKYGVTYQYTFVQVDNDGNEIKQWSATSLDKALAGIQ